MSDDYVMGDIANQANYDEYGLPSISSPRPPPEDPRKYLPQWAAQADAHPDQFEPLTSKVFPNPPPTPDETLFTSRFPGGGPPVLEDNRPAWIAKTVDALQDTPMPFSQHESFPGVQRAADATGRFLLDAATPQTPVDYGMMLTPGGIVPKVVAGAIGSLFDADPAEAGKGTLIRRGASRMGELVSGAERGLTGAARELPTLGITSPVPRAGASAEEISTAARDSLRGSLFDYSRLNEVPSVGQFDLPRYEPPRGVSARVQDLINNDDVAEKMLKMMQHGREIGGDTFYGTEPLRNAFTQEFGFDKGRAKFDRFMDFASGASPRSKVPENVRNASYYYVLDAQGKPMPAIGDANPAPYGHLAQRLHQQNANTIVDGGWDLFRNPKPPSFSQNLRGNLRPVTVDAHAFKAPAMLSEDPRFLLGSFKPAKDAPTINPRKMYDSGKLTMEDALKEPTYWAARPNDNEYLAMENYYKRLSREAGFPEPGIAQAAGWSGGGEMTGLGSPAGDPFIRAVENRANITASMMGISPAEALSRFMRGVSPLR